MPRPNSSGRFRPLSVGDTSRWERHFSRGPTEVRFACDLSLRPPLRPIGQIEILESRLAVRRVDRMVRLLARVVRVGIETADMLVDEVLSRPMRDRKAVARYAGLIGALDQSDAKRRERRLATAGNARVRRGMIQLAWRFLVFQKQGALAQWYQARTTDSRVGTRKTMILAFARTAVARKLLIALWRFITTGEPLEGVIMRPAG
jgi:Transposase IS116/IS110/IS902 family